MKYQTVIIYKQVPYMHTIDIANEIFELFYPRISYEYLV